MIEEFGHRILINNKIIIRNTTIFIMWVSCLGETSLEVIGYNISMTQYLINWPNVFIMTLEVYQVELGPYQINGKKYEKIYPCRVIDINIICVISWRRNNSPF